MNARVSQFDRDTTVELTTRIIAGYVARNELPSDKLAALITDIHGTLLALGASTPGSGASPKAVQQRPAVPVEESITPDWIICLEDGRKCKALKRHLRTAFGLSPEGYRQKWGLPDDYPMVAPNYSLVRKAIAKGPKYNSPLSRPGGTSQAPPSHPVVVSILRKAPVVPDRTP